jgi:hypothetical protein
LLDAGRAPTSSAGWAGARCAPTARHTGQEGHGRMRRRDHEPSLASSRGQTTSWSPETRSALTEMDPHRPGRPLADVLDCFPGSPALLMTTGVPIVTGAQGKYLTGNGHDPRGLWQCLEPRTGWQARHAARRGSRNGYEGYRSGELPGVGCLACQDRRGRLDVGCCSTCIPPEGSNAAVGQMTRASVCGADA